MVLFMATRCDRGTGRAPYSRILALAAYALLFFLCASVQAAQISIAPLNRTTPVNFETEILHAGVAQTGGGASLRN